MEKSPQQIIYDAVYRISSQLNYQTYTYLPAERVSYPFVFIGETSVEDRHTKSGLFGDIIQTVHVYHTYKKRAEVTTMMDNIKMNCYRLNEAEDLYLHLNSGDSDLLLDDSESTEALIHGILDLSFTFNFKGVL